MPKQNPEIREKSKKVREGNQPAGTKNVDKTSTTLFSGSHDPDHLTDYDAIEILNKVLHKKR